VSGELRDDELSTARPVRRAHLLLQRRDGVYSINVAGGRNRDLARELGGMPGATLRDEDNTWHAPVTAESTETLRLLGMAGLTYPLVGELLAEGEVPAPDAVTAAMRIVAAERALIASALVAPALPTLTVSETRAAVRARGPRQWLVRGVIIAGSMVGVGAEAKLGKSMALLDLAVSVASGTAWMGTAEVCSPGPVVVFAAEDDDAEMLRRIDAVCASRGIDPDTLDIHLCAAVPNLSSDASMLEVTETLGRIRPAMAILDPLYLAMGGGAELSKLNQMGELLNRFKAACSATGTAGLVNTHFNKTGTGSGAERFSGVGLREWARTLIAGTTTSSSTDDEGHAVKIISWEVSGNSVQAQTLVIQRTMWAEDDFDLDSPLHYVVQPLDAASVAAAAMPRGDASALSASRRSLSALTANAGWMSVRSVQEWDGNHLPSNSAGEPCKYLLNDTVSKALRKLAVSGEVVTRVEPAATYYAVPGTPADAPLHDGAPF